MKDFRGGFLIFFHLIRRLQTGEPSRKNQPVNHRQLVPRGRGGGAFPRGNESGEEEEEEEEEALSLQTEESAHHLLIG